MKLNSFPVSSSLNAMSDRNRIHCPKCNARLVIPAEQVSPYIRCGVCDILFQIDTAPSVSPSTVPPEKMASQQSSVISEQGPRVYGSDNAGIRYLNSRMGNERPRSTFGKFVPLIIVSFILLIVVGIVHDSGQNRNRSYSKSYRTPAKSVVERYAESKTVDSSLDPASPKSVILAQREYWLSRKQGNVKPDDVNPPEKPYYLSSPDETIYNDQSIKYDKSVDSALMNTLYQHRHLFELDFTDANFKISPLLSSKFFPYLTYLDLSDAKVTRYTMSKLGTCSYLVKLTLKGTPFSDKELKGIARHKNLEQLDLRLTEVTYDGLKTIRMPKLKILKVSAGVFSDAEQATITKNNPGLKIYSL